MFFAYLHPDENDDRQLSGGSDNKYLLWCLLALGKAWLHMNMLGSMRHIPALVTIGGFERTKLGNNFGNWRKFHHKYLKCFSKFMEIKQTYKQKARMRNMVFGGTRSLKKSAWRWKMTVLHFKSQNEGRNVILFLRSQATFPSFQQKKKKKKKKTTHVIEQSTKILVDYNGIYNMFCA